MYITSLSFYIKNVFAMNMNCCLNCKDRRYNCHKYCQKYYRAIKQRTVEKNLYYTEGENFIIERCRNKQKNKKGYFIYDK